MFYFFAKYSLINPPVKIPFQTIENLLIEKGIYKPNKGKQGRPSIPVNILLGALFLQSWYGLSDPMTEELIYDRISFRINI